MRATPHLSFNGLCEAAFGFYERCFGAGRVTMIRYGDSPMADEAPPEWRDKILHATLASGDLLLMGGDVLPGQYEAPKGFAILLGLDDAAEADRIFQALAEAGTVQVPLQETFWSARFGVVVDRFGVPWEINCGKADAAT